MSQKCIRVPPVGQELVLFLGLGFAVGSVLLFCQFFHPPDPLHSVGQLVIAEVVLFLLEPLQRVVVHHVTGF